MAAVAVIPARYGSSRFPGKPLVNRTGKYLIQHVYEQVSRAQLLNSVIVATDDERILAAVESFGGRARMTSPDHVCGTDRVAEVARELDRQVELIVNVQGDEPEIEPDYLDQLVRLLQGRDGCQMATLACPFSPGSDPADPNCVKVVVDASGRAIYFSRSLIPYPRDGGQADGPERWLLHLGVYAYRRDFLLEYAGWPPARLERIEQLEQLRALERGVAIAVGRVERATVGIDTPADYEAFVRRVGAPSPVSSPSQNASDTLGGQ